MNRSWILTQLAKKYMKKLTTKTILEAQKAYEKYATMPLYEAQKELKDARLKVEKHITNTYLKQLQAPQGVKPILKCWEELT